LPGYLPDDLRPFGLGGRTPYRLRVNALLRLIDAPNFEIHAVAGARRAALCGHAGFRAVQAAPGNTVTTAIAPWAGPDPPRLSGQNIFGPPSALWDVATPLRVGATPVPSCANAGGRNWDRTSVKVTIMGLDGPGAAPADQRTAAAIASAGVAVGRPIRRRRSPELV
jgi:hypothetical protein